MTDAPTFWEDFYAAGTSRWSGKPNEVLVAHVADLAPGTALDLGCGQGGDAIWLAQRGWQVTATDIAASALRFAAERADEAGFGDAIRWERHDLAETFPAGRFDLVCASYLQSPVEMRRDEILRHAAGAVAPGGALVIVSHAGWPTWMLEPPHEVEFQTTEDLLDVLRLDAGWTVERQAIVDRPSTSPAGEAGTRPDNVLRVRRR